MNPDFFGELMQQVVLRLEHYRGVVPTLSRFAATGIRRVDVLAEIRKMAEQERSRWRVGRVSGAVYHGDDGHVAFLNEVYALQSQNNPLHADVWPSTSKFEAEIVAMTA